MQKPDKSGEGPEVTELLAEFSRGFRQNFRRLAPLILGLLVVAVAYLGLFKVDSGSQGVVRRFGQLHRLVDPGLHFAIPLIERVNVVDVEQVRRVEVGFRGDRSVPAEALMLTGDENIVEVRMAVQYRVSDPTSFLFRLADPVGTLHTASEVAIRTVVGQNTIDDVMTRGRSDVQVSVRALLQRLMDDYQSGIEITEVKLDSVDAPDEVKDAFNAVTRAREDREKLINQAQGYAEDRLPKARGEARRIEREAEAYKEQRVLRARGEVAKFEAVYQEYEKAKEVTRRRLYLETMERVMKRVQRKVVLDRQVGDSALPLLQLSGAAKARGNAGGNP